MDNEEKIVKVINKVTENVDFLWIRSTGDLIFNFGYGCFFKLQVDANHIGLMYLFVPEKQRRKGNARKIISYLQKVAKSLDMGFWLVCNPFVSSGFCISSGDLEDFEYDANPEAQDIMVKLVQSLGFKERNIGLAMSLYDVMGRAIFYKYAKAPRLFVFNCLEHGPDYEEEGISEETWKFRLKDFEENYYSEDKVVHP